MKYIVHVAYMGDKSFTKEKDAIAWARKMSRKGYNVDMWREEK